MFYLGFRVCVGLMVAVGFRVYFGFGMCLEPIRFSMPTTFKNLDAQSADPPHRVAAGIANAADPPCTEGSGS